MALVMRSNERLNDKRIQSGLYSVLLTPNVVTDISLLIALIPFWKRLN